MLGISGKAVSKWERGLSKPCEEHWERLVARLGLMEMVISSALLTFVPKRSIIMNIKIYLFKETG